MWTPVVFNIVFNMGRIPSRRQDKQRHVAGAMLRLPAAGKLN
jgi:hypothetical protein